MKIDANTKISKIIRYNKDAIEIIASINPHFNKLRNPVLRRVLAPRVTISDAARIGKCSVNDFFNVLSEIGFVIDNNITTLERVEGEDNQTIIECIKAGKIHTMDVRPILSSGSDPFNEIMKETEILPKDFALEIINSFEPSPLIKMLKGKGYISYTVQKDEVVHTYLMKVNSEKEQKELASNLVDYISINELKELKNKFNDRCIEVDVRNMEMPLPMVTILNELNVLKKDQAIYVHHKKIPQYLLLELNERGAKTYISEIDEGNVKLLIHF